MLRIVKKITIIAASVAMISGWAIAGSLEPPSGPAPTMKSLQDIYDKVAIGTEISSLPYTISSSGFYYITQDLTCPAGAHGITITADNVSLDLMGFSLVGPGGTGNYDGVRIHGRNNVEIRNGTVRNFPKRGIHAFGHIGKGSRIINIRTANNEGGIYLTSTGNLVKGCTAFLNTISGIFASKGSTVTGNTAHDNGGAGIFASNGSTVTGNTAHDNGGNGIHVEIGATVTGNTTFGNTRWGIYLSDYNLVYQNTAYDNTFGNMNSCGSCAFGTNVRP